MNHNQHPNRREVRKEKQCPICYSGDLNGVGRMYSKHGNKRYYKCDRCGMTWTCIVEYRVERISYTEVIDINTRGTPE